MPFRRADDGTLVACPHCLPRCTSRRTDAFDRDQLLRRRFTADESARLLGAVTDAVVGFTGERIRPNTWVVVREVNSGQWGIGGNALGLAEVRALQAEPNG